MLIQLSCNLFVTIRTRYIFLMNLGKRMSQTKEVQKKSKKSKNNLCKIILTCIFKKTKVAFLVVKCLYSTDTVTM